MIGLREFWDAVLRRRLVVFLCVAGGVLGALMVNMLSVPKYRAEAVVKISGGEKSLSIFGELPGSPSEVDPVQSQIEIIKSRTLARNAVASLGLNIQVKAKNPEIKVIRAWSQASVAPGAYRLKTSRDSVFLFDERGQNLSRAERGDTLSGPGFSMIVDWEKDLANVRLTVEDLDKVAERFRGGYSAVQKGRTDLVRISYSSPDPELAKEAVNAIAQGYVDYSLNTVREQARSARMFIENQIDQVKKELTAAEDSLRLFKEAEGIFELSESAQNLIGRLSDLDGALAEAQATRRINERRISALLDQLSDTSAFFGKYRIIASSPEMASNPQLAALSQRMNELAEKKASLMADLSPNHPEVVAIDEEMERLKSDMTRIASKALAEGPAATDPILQNIYSQLVQAQVDLESAKAQERAISHLISEREAVLRTFPSKEQRLAELTRRVEADRKVYAVLLEKLQEAKIEEARQVSDARVVDPAITPEKPVSPRKGLNLLLGLLLGTLLGLGLAYALEELDTSVRGPKDLEHIDPGAPFLGYIPVADEHDEGTLRDAIYTVSMNILYHSKDRDQVFLFTSAEPEAGKSFVLSQCAMALAEMGKKVLIVDADMRKPQMHRFFGIEDRGQGLSDILHGRRSPSSVLKKLGERLFLITSGERLGLSAGALASGVFAEFIASVSKDYDAVLVDAPPAGLGLVDTLEMSSKIPWTVLVARYQRTDRNALLESVRQIKNRGGNILGFTINFFDPSEARYGYRYYYYYYYYYYQYGTGHGGKHPKKSLWRRILYWLGFRKR